MSDDKQSVQRQFGDVAAEYVTGTVRAALRLPDGWSTQEK